MAVGAPSCFLIIETFSLSTVRIWGWGWLKSLGVGMLWTSPLSILLSSKPPSLWVCLLLKLKSAYGNGWTLYLKA